MHVLSYDEGKKENKTNKQKNENAALFFVCVVMFVIGLVSTQASSHWPSSGVIGVLAFHC